MPLSIRDYIRIVEDARMAVVFQNGEDFVIIGRL